MRDECANIHQSETQRRIKMRRWWCIRLIVVVLIRWRVASSEAQSEYLAHGCSGNPAQNVSDFIGNLDATFADLKTQLMNTATLFATASYAARSQPVFGMAQCRDYMTRADCVACYDSAQLVIRTNCSIHNATQPTPPPTGARVTLQGCFLRYEDYGFYSKSTENSLSCSDHEAPLGTEFGPAKDRLMSDLARAAPKVSACSTTPKSRGCFAANKRVVSKSENVTVYGVAQCLDSITPLNCRGCLNAASDLLSQCRSASYGLVWDAACFIRYSNIPFFTDDHITDLPGRSKTKEIIIGVSMGAAGLVLVSFSLLWYKFSRQLKNALIANILGATELQNPNRYSYNDLKEATNGFSEENKLGQGAFGVVYKANLENGTIVAVKKLDMSNRKAKEDYETEVRLISNVHHRNLVRLLGCCSKGSELLLVLEYMENGSLDRFLYGNNRRGLLNWKQRCDMIFGTARGLAYLHEHYFATMIHRDIKPANILVDNLFQPKIADFGLAKLLPENQTHLSSAGFAGTLGYTAPEYALGGHLTDKVDVYSFGIVVLEIISGIRCTDMRIGSESGSYLLKKAWDLYESDRHDELVDEALNSNGVEAQDLKKMVEIALMCTQSPPSLRPTMSQILSMLTQHRLPEQRPLQRPNHVQSLTSITTASYH